jgi:predicted TIM-barrel fold metal-dependent hydrolase
MDTAVQVGFRPGRDERTGREFVYNPRGTIREWGKKYYDLELRRSALREAGFDKQVLICDQGFAPDYVDLQTSVKLSRAFNDSVARIQREHEEFIGCADVPHQDVNAAIAEAQRAVCDLNLKAIRIYGTWSGKNIESEDWWPFYKVVDELNVPLLLHSFAVAGHGDVNPNLIGRDRLQSMREVRDPVTGVMKPAWPLTGALGFTMEAMCVIAGLVLHGVLKQYPNLRIGVLECGAGWAPFIASRLDQVFEVKDAWRSLPHWSSHFPISTAPSDYVRKHFWFALDYVGEALVPMLIRDFGLGKKLLAQTDYPHHEGSMDVVRWIELMDISETDKENILGKNTAELIRP